MKPMKRYIIFQANNLNRTINFATKVQSNANFRQLIIFEILKNYCFSNNFQMNKIILMIKGYCLFEIDLDFEPASNQKL